MSEMTDARGVSAGVFEGHAFRVVERQSNVFVHEAAGGRPRELLAAAVRQAGAGRLISRPESWDRLCHGVGQF